MPDYTTHMRHGPFEIRRRGRFKTVPRNKFEEDDELPSRIPETTAEETAKWLKHASKAFRTADSEKEKKELKNTLLMCLLRLRKLALNPLARAKLLHSGADLPLLFLLDKEGDNAILSSVLNCVIAFVYERRITKEIFGSKRTMQRLMGFLKSSDDEISLLAARFLTASSQDPRYLPYFKLNGIECARACLPRIQKENPIKPSPFASVCNLLISRIAGHDEEQEKKLRKRAIDLESRKGVSSENEDAGGTGTASVDAVSFFKGKIKPRDSDKGSIISADFIMFFSSMRHTQKEKVERSCLLIQRYVRGYLARVEFTNAKKNIVKLQANIRAYLSRKRVLEKMADTAEEEEGMKKKRGRKYRVSDSNHTMLPTRPKTQSSRPSTSVSGCFETSYSQYTPARDKTPYQRFAAIGGKQRLQARDGVENISKLVRRSVIAPVLEVEKKRNLGPEGMRMLFAFATPEPDEAKGLLTDPITLDMVKGELGEVRNLLKLVAKAAKKDRGRKMAEDLRLRSRALTERSNRLNDAVSRKQEAIYKRQTTPEPFFRRPDTYTPSTNYIRNHNLEPNHFTVDKDGNVIGAFGRYG